jgi:hypothetical protein
MACAAPALVVPIVSEGTPTARSSRPSSFRSPAATAAPNESPDSDASLMPAVFCSQTWFPVGPRPAEEP